jgi:hypothetical protein
MMRMADSRSRSPAAVGAVFTAALELTANAETYVNAP